MTNIEKYKKAFREALDVEEDKLDKLTYQSIPNWDSVGHMHLISTLEDTFEIMMETDDIVDLSSFSKGIEILQKYDVEL
jgi:acyl carrier protein